MQTTASDPSLSQRLHSISASARFFTVSLLVHIVLIIFGGSAVMFHQISEAPDFMAGGDAGGLVADTTLADEPSSSPKFEKPEMPVPVSGTSGASVPGLDAITSSSIMNSTFQIGAVSVSEIKMGKAASGSTDDAMAKALAEGLNKAAAGMSRAGGTSMVKFFGKTTQVQAVVFVVDISGSMVMGSKSAKTYEDLEDEVKRVIRGLDAKTMFGIVAFSGDAYHYKPELVAATNDEKQRAIFWLRKQTPVGWDKTEDPEEKRKHQGTRADKGLEAAFKLQPDTIFFVSDGEPTGANPTQILKSVEEWQKGRPKPVMVNSVAYLADSGQKFMQDLAKQSAGSFREINPRDARKKR